MSTCTTQSRKAAPATQHHFNAQIIPFSSRPRLMVGDVVELCRNCLPANRGKLAVIEKIDDEGDCFVRALMWHFDQINKTTGVITGGLIRVWVPPENLYRRSSSTSIAAIKGYGRA